MGRRQGVKLHPGLGRQAYKVDGKFKFWGGLALHIWGGGPELLKALYAQAEQRGIPIALRDAGHRADPRGGRVIGVVARSEGAPVEIAAGAVVLACGSFESNPEMRARYLGPGWDVAKVRGTRFNMGAGLMMALARRRAPVRQLVRLPFGRLGRQRAALRRPHDRRPVPEAQLSVRHRRQCERRALRRRGRQLPQPHLCEIWRRDHEAAGHVCLAGVRRQGHATCCAANTASAASPRPRRNTLEELAPKLTGVDPEAFLRTVRAFNAACRTDVPFNPEHSRRARRRSGLAIDKTNWANPLDTPPFHAYHVTTGVTFTFGGLRSPRMPR